MSIPFRRWFEHATDGSLAGRVAVAFLIGGSAWIVLSDRLVEMIAADRDTLVLLQTYKGWTFVLGTAALLYAFIALESRRRGRAEAREMMVLERITDAFFALDREWCFTYVNGKAEDLFLRSRQDLLGRRVWRVFPGAMGGTADQHYHRAMDKGVSLSFTVESAVAPGRWLEQHVYPSDTGLSVFCRDVTAERELERQLYHAQKMEAVGRLAGGMAHDFNNVLTAIRGTAALARQDLESSADVASVRADLEEIGEHTDRAAELTRQLLTLGRRREEQRRIIPFNDVVLGSETLLRRLTATDGIELRVDLDPMAGRVRADPGQLQQLIMNLVVNGRDAMPDGGTLRIETRSMVVGADDAEFPARLLGSGRYVRLAVSDTGCGMDEEIVDHIFEPFYTTKDEGEGTGLGLSIAYGIVRKNDGHVFVESEPGRGTTFRICFAEVEGAPVEEEAGARLRMS